MHVFTGPQCLLVTFPKGWPVWSHTARVQRGESSTARCASTGDEWVTPPTQCAIEEGNVLEGACGMLESAVSTEARRLYWSFAFSPASTA